MGALPIRVTPTADGKGFRWEFIGDDGTVLWPGDGISYPTDRKANVAGCVARKKFVALQAEIDGD